MSDLPPLTLVRPQSLSEALAALKRPGARIYAGGTDVLVAMRRRDSWATTIRGLVDIKGVPEAAGIVASGDAVRLGALTTPKLIMDAPSAVGLPLALIEAAAHTSAPTLRARGTLGGNLVTPHPSGDLTTALLALDAAADVASNASDVSTISVESLLAHPDELEAGESLVVSVRVAPNTPSAFEKHGQRAAFTRSIGSVAVALGKDGCRVALGGVGRRPQLAPDIAANLDRGKEPLDGVAILQTPLHDPRLTRPLLRSLILRAHDRARSQR